MRDGKGVRLTPQAQGKLMTVAQSDVRTAPVEGKSTAEVKNLLPLVRGT